ncbi:hypothetical protein OOK31_03085 [Streptomyces sp. NBC_00249]|uniref:hypothetical protein n=1 Tax=Streptomyces sp. NBC_00249 TaxID=2975690 RepID=UPI00224F4220|nr:hypothetical protein [Streptomyces sp. NBC_00249]MCX5192887.1 hypothetical protein [Streptomyces sp. NBC_00249]
MSAIKKLFTVPVAAVATALLALTVLSQSGELEYQATDSAPITASVADSKDNNGWD